MDEEAGNQKSETGPEAASTSHLSNDTITDILLRLPAKSVLSAGAVCKAWRDITGKSTFIADHALRRPTDVVLYTYEYSAGCTDRRRGYSEDEIALDLLPVSSPDDDVVRRRRLIRYPRNRNITFLLLASCNGVLLFIHRAKGTFLLCNPSTRRWAQLPPPLALGPNPNPNPNPAAAMDEIDAYAFYFHEQSGEYRLLLHRRSRYRSWFILSTGAAEPRTVDLHAMLPEMMGITGLLVTTPVALNGRLHWPPRQLTGPPSSAAANAGETSASTTDMAVFDTMSETFHLMAGPPTATAEQTKVFAMEGKLAAADFGDKEHVDLWFLEEDDDSTAGRWERRYRAPAPWRAGTRRVLEERRPRHAVAAAGDDREGTVMLGNHLGLLVYDLRTRTARTVGSVAASERSVVVSRHVFRESLVHHPSFAARSAAELGVNVLWN